MTPRAELLVSAPWGSGPGEVPLATTRAAMGDDLEPEPRWAPMPLRIAVDPGGGVHALAQAEGDPPVAIHFAEGGTVAGRTPLAAEPGDRVADFAVGVAGAVYTVHVAASGEARIAMAAPGGEGWSHPLTASSAEPPRLLLDGESRLHVALDDGHGTVLRMDREGRAEGTFHADAPGNRAFITPDGRLVFATWFADAQRRGLVAFDPRDGRRTAWVGDDALQRWLTWPLGVDAEARMYAWHFGEVARMEMQGGPEPLARIDDVVADPSRLQPADSWRVDPSGRLYLPMLDSEAFRIVRLTFD